MIEGYKMEVQMIKKEEDQTQTTTRRHDLKS